MSGVVVVNFEREYEGVGRRTIEARAKDTELLCLYKPDLTEHANLEAASFLGRMFGKNDFGGRG